MTSLMSFWCFYCYLRMDFTHCSGLPIVEFEKVTVDWKIIIGNKKTCRITKGQNIILNSILNTNTFCTKMKAYTRPFMTLSRGYTLTIFYFRVCTYAS